MSSVAAARPGLPHRPRLRRSFNVQLLDDPPALFLLSEHRHFVFEGTIYLLLAPLLDGRRTLADVVQEVGEHASIGEVYQAVIQLMRRGCLAETNELATPEHLSFWDSFFVSDHDVAEGLERHPVRVLGASDEVAAWEAALRGAGLRVSPDGPVAILVTDDYLHDELRAWNRERLADGRCWMLVKPRGPQLWIGPLFRPGTTGCWECLYQRLNANQQLERFCLHSGRFTEVKSPLAAQTPGTLSLAMSLAALELAKRLVLPSRAGLDGKMITFDVESFQITEHTLVKRPQCPACGNPDEATRGPRPVSLTSRPKTHGHRCADPEETFQRLKHHISPITGAIASLNSRGVNAFGLSHNFTAGHYFPVPDGDVKAMYENTLARSGGKGSTEVEAKTSTVCESLERYAGIRWGDEWVIRDSYRNLRNEAIHAREVQLFSDQQYASRETWNRQILSNQQYVPEPLDDEAVIAWTAAWSLSHSRTRYLPTGYCFYGHRDPGCYFTRCDSNGNAAGNNLEEAILQGFLELVERDAVALWWYNRVRRPAVDVASFGLDYWDRMQTHYRQQLHRDVHVLDITADLGIPTFAVISRRTDRPVEDILVGFAAHLDPRTAL
ncbi:MAG: TOMM precursor leader peptide-binding protein, partial [Pirellulaceae bacterium]